jgi:glutathione-independent formaldehyde dehydrogenase
MPLSRSRPKPSFIVSQRLPLSKAPEAYEHFDKRGEGTGRDWTKVLLKPDLDSKAA